MQTDDEVTLLDDLCYKEVQDIAEYRQYLTDEMKELLAATTRGVIENVEENTPFGPSVRMQGLVTAEDRWIHFRGSTHSTFLLRKMMQAADAVVSRLEAEAPLKKRNSDRSKSMASNSSPANLKDLMDRATSAAPQLRRVQLESSTTQPRTKSLRARESTTHSQLHSPPPFSWADYMISPDTTGQPMDDGDDDTKLGAVSLSESNSDSTTARSSPGTRSPIQKTSNILASPLHAARTSSPCPQRPLRKEEIPIFGLLPLEDERILRACPYCHRILMEHAFTAHYIQCQEAANQMRSRQDHIEVIKHTSKEPHPIQGNAHGITDLQQAAQHGMDRQHARPNVKTSAVRSSSPSLPPTAPRPNQTAPPIQVAGYAKQGFGAHPGVKTTSSQVSSPIPSQASVSANSSSTINFATAKNKDSATRTSSNHTSSTSHAAPSTNQNGLPKPSIGSNKNGVIPSSGNGSIVIVTSPRAGLKSSIGQSSLSSSLPPNMASPPSQYKLDSSTAVHSTSATTSRGNLATDATYNYGSKTDLVPAGSGTKRSFSQFEMAGGAVIGGSALVEPSSTKRVSYGVPPSVTPTRSFNTSSTRVSNRANTKIQAPTSSMTHVPTANPILRSPISRGPSQAPVSQPPTTIGWNSLSQRPQAYMVQHPPAPTLGLNHPLQSTTQYVSPTALQQSGEIEHNDLTNQLVDPDYAMFVFGQSGAAYAPENEEFYQ